MVFTKFKQFKGVIDCHDLDAFVKKELGQTYGALHSYRGDAANGSYYEMYASPESPENFTVEEAEELLGAWRAADLPGHSSHFGRVHDEVIPDVDVVLWELCRRGLLEEGEYLLLAWW